MEENKNHYTGKRWVSREQIEKSGKSYEKKSGYQGSRGEKSGYSRTDKDGYRKNGYGDKAYSYKGDKERESYKKSYEKKDYGDSKSYGEKKSYGDRKKEYTETYSRNGESRYDGKKGYRSGYRDGSNSYNRTAVNEKANDETRRSLNEREDAAVETASTQAGGEDVLPFLIIGRNAVREAIKSDRSIDKILVVPEHDGSLNEILTLAHDKKLIIRETDKKKLDEICMPFGHGGKTANHQGIVAYAAGMEYCTVSDILSVAKEKGEDPFIIVLDGVEDPHNLGSIIRSSECAGAHGVVIGKRRSASVTAAAVKAAAGATAYMKVAKVTNVSGALEEMKRAGLWIAGADMSGVSMHEQGMNGPLAIVIGGEGGGLTKLVKETCDFLISIPMQGQINSLNASVAAAVLMFEKRRQDSVKE